MSTLPKIVNVASVPQRSPFRYPGGKTWLVPYVRVWLRSLPSKPRLFAEPFAGGAIISMTVGFESLAGHVSMIELDDDVAAVWQTILGQDAKWLADDALFKVVASIKGDFVMTYDNDPEVLDMAKTSGFDTEVVPMKNTHHATMVELLIGKDLNWAREMRKPRVGMLPGFEV